MSSINTNNLDVNFPKPGVNNSSQGFRDNFTTIKTNLDYASTEIADLQAKSIVKAALNDTSVNNDMSGTLISNALIQGFRSTTSSLGNNLTGTVLVNLTKGDVHIGTIAANTTISLQFAGWAPSGTKSQIELHLYVQDHTSAIDFNGMTFNQSLSLLPNLSGNKVYAQKDVTLLAYRISTVDCGATLTIEPITTNQKASQMNLRTPSSVGVSGDRKGEFCFDINNIYICTLDYDGSTPIWKRASLSTI